MTTIIEGGYDEFVGVARQALSNDNGARALIELGWWDLLADLGNDDNRPAAFALFRAQGLELASSPALGGLLAQPYIEITDDLDPGSVVATIPRTSPRRGVVDVAVGDVTDMRLLIHRPGRGIGVVEIDQVHLQAIEVPGRLCLYEVHVDDDHWQPVVTEDVAVPARRRSVALGRIALALEMLGAAEGSLALAVEHAKEREQFGQPIGKFQAVRHLLAWATTDCVAVESAAASAVALDPELPPRFDEIVKALAGRNARRACERALQVLGAIGFTAEHKHHHFHSRVLALDGLLGTSADLTQDLGTWMRTQQTDLLLPGALLVPGHEHLAPSVAP